MDSRQKEAIAQQLGRSPVGEDLQICAGLIDGGMMVEQLSEDLLQEMRFMVHDLAVRRSLLTKEKRGCGNV